MSLTKFPNGVGQMIGVGVGHATTVTIPGVKLGDKLLKVFATAHDGAGACTHAHDRTAVFAITADNTITSATSTANQAVFVLYAQK